MKIVHLAGKILGKGFVVDHHHVSVGGFATGNGNLG